MLLSPISEFYNYEKHKYYGVRLDRLKTTFNPREND